MKEKKKLDNVLKMEKVAIPAFSAFVGNCNVQHAGAEWRGEHALRNHTYLIPEGNLKNPVGFLY